MIKLLHQDKKSNRLSISEFHKFEGTTQFNQVAAKFVLTGEEIYEINGKNYTVKTGEYILGNGGTLSEVFMNRHTIGICVDISSEMIADVANLYFEQSDVLNFILGDNFLINKYRTENTSLGLKLRTLAGHLLKPGNSSNSDLLSDELFLSLGESIVLDQSKIFGELSKLNFRKQLVNEENYRKLSLSKEYIDDCFLEEINIDTLLKIACMSKFNYIRLFKLTFGISPYQYIISKRLAFAKQELSHGKKVTEVAFTTGFSDTASFSKAFKAHYSVAPSKMANLS